MNDRKMEIIKELMAELQSEMDYSEEDLSERLGREPKIEVMKMETEEPMEGDDMAMEGLLSPEEKLKERIMKLRG